MIFTGVGGGPWLRGPRGSAGVASTLGPGPETLLLCNRQKGRWDEGAGSRNLVAASFEREGRYLSPLRHGIVLTRCQKVKEQNYVLAKSG